MSGVGKQSGRVSTLALSILVALGVIAVLAGAEYAIPRWLHAGPGESGSFFSDKDSTSGPSGPASASGPSIQPGPSGDTAARRGNGRASNPEFPTAKSLACPPGDSRCWDRKARSMPPKQSADTNSKPGVSERPNPQNSPAPRDAGQSPVPTAQDARTAEQNLRATEDATAHLVALEREELDHLSNRARALNDRIEAAERQQTTAGWQLRDDLAFSQQRLQSSLNQADNALRGADVLNAKRFLEQAKAELEKLANLLARQ